LDEIQELVSRIEGFERTIELNINSASVLIMPRGGRILGVDIGNGNLLWVNPRIEDTLLNKEWNTGGIRTWLSPERAFFFDDPEKFEGWRCPPGIDPARYQVTEKQKLSVELKSAISAQDNAAKQTLSGHLTKRIEVQWAELSKDSAHLRLAIHDVLRVGGFKPPFALWCLAQVDPGETGEGYVTVPVMKYAKPIHYFSRIPSSYLQILEDRVKFIIDGCRELKLGISPEDLPTPSRTSLRYNFRKKGDSVTISMSSRTAAKSQNECVDPPRSDPNGPKGVIQLYNSELTLSGMRYGELEIQGAQARTLANDSREAEEELVIDFQMYSSRAT
jgi:hypothetical protein